MPGFVGVDAGGSKTIAAYARDEGVVRTHLGEAANPRVRGVEAAADAIAAAVTGALAGERADALAVGAAGAGSPAICDALALALTRRFPDVRIGVSDDAHIALRAIVPQGDGIVLVAGTGALAYAEIADRRVRAGGYGYLLGEEGSGFAIGAAALRRLLHAFDGRVKSDALLDALRERLRARTAQDVVAAVYERTMPVAEIAGCAPLVLEHAARGVRSATVIVQDAAKALFELLRSVVTSLEEKDVPLAFSGGLLRENNLLTYLLDLRIANEFPHLAPVKGGADPYLGALADARRLPARA
jgi:glucosamine kinase